MSITWLRLRLLFSFKLRYGFDFRNFLFVFCCSAFLPPFNFLRLFRVISDFFLFLLDLRFSLLLFCCFLFWHLLLFLNLHKPNLFLVIQNAKKSSKIWWILHQSNYNFVISKYTRALFFNLIFFYQKNNRKFIVF